jgi:hypothetical protein
LAIATVENDIIVSMSEPLPLPSEYWFESKPLTLTLMSEPLPLMTEYWFESKPLTLTLMPESELKVNVEVLKSKSKPKMSQINTLLLPKKRKQSKETKLFGEMLKSLCGERIPTFRGYYPKIRYGPSVDYKLMYRSDSFKKQEAIRFKATLTRV